MKRLAVVIALAAIAGALWYLKRPSPSNATASEPLSSPPPAQPTKRITKVTKLATTEQRKLLADRIAAAQAARTATPPGTGGATRAPAAPSLPAEAVAASQAETMRVEIRAAMREVVPMLAACYETDIASIPEPSVKVVAELTLTGDPDIGTLVDAHQVLDESGKPLPETFDDCLRSTLQLLALPPLAEGDKFEVRYPFVFSKT